MNKALLFIGGVVIGSLAVYGFLACSNLSKYNNSNSDTFELNSLQFSVPSKWSFDFKDFANNKAYIKTDYKPYTVILTAQAKKETDSKLSDIKKNTAAKGSIPDGTI